MMAGKTRRIFKYETVIVNVASAMLLLACGTEVNHPSKVDIIGGTTRLDPTHPSSFATVALVRKNAWQKSWETFCSATLIASDTIVTANHCLYANVIDHLFNKSQVRILFTNPSNQTQTELREIVGQGSFAQQLDSILYPLFDISWIKFKGKLPFSYRPVEVYSGIDKLKKGTPISLAGFGQIVVDETSENPLDGKKRVVGTIFNSYLNTNISQGLMLFGPTPGKSACYGDSGGSAFVKDGSSWKLLGVTNGISDQIPNDRGACHDGFGLFTYIGAYKTWLSRSAGIDLSPSMPAEEIDVSFTPDREFLSFLELCHAQDVPKNTLYTLKILMDRLETYDCDQASKNIGKIEAIEDSDFRHPVTYAPKTIPKLDVRVLKFLPNLKRISARSVDLTVISLPEIKSLEAFSVDLLPSEIEHLSLGNMPNLRRLYVTGKSLLSLDLRGTPKLEELEISQTKMQNVGSILGLEGLQNLTSLSLLESNIGDHVILKNLSHLKYLNLYGNFIANLSLKGLPKLETLDVSDNVLKTADFLTELKNIKNLNVSQNHLPSSFRCPNSITEENCLVKNSSDSIKYSNVTVTAVEDTLFKALPESSTILTDKAKLRFKKGTSIKVRSATLDPETGHYILRFENQPEGFDFGIGYLYSKHVLLNKGN